MDFNHSDDRRMLADTLGRYLAQHYPIATRHSISVSEQGWSPDHWTGLAELGVIGALFPENAGGFGGMGFDIAVVFEQLGRALVVEPFLGTLMAGRVLARACDQDALLGEVIAGTRVLAFAHEEPSGAIETQADPAGDGWAVSGAKAVVPQLEAADTLLVSAQVAGAATIELFLVDKATPGVAVHGYPMIDGGRGGELTLTASPATRVAPEGSDLIEDAIAAGIVALAWEAVGIMDVLKASTLDYLRTRSQFGTVIGKFQALQHRMATVAIEIEQARSTAINAAAALESDRHARERAVSAAKYTIGRVGTLVAEEAIQMHGGIGMTWELPLAHYAKRLIMIDHQLGDEDHHLQRFIALSPAAT